MKEEIKHAIDAAANHPKVAVAATTIFTSNVWLDYGEPAIKALTSLVGLAVLIALLIKHILDIKNSFDKKD